MLNIRHHIEEMKKLLTEQEESRTNIFTVNAEVAELDRRYLQKQLNYKKYHEIRQEILANKSKDEIYNSFQNYITAIKNRLTELNSRIFQEVHNDESYEELKIGSRTSSAPTLELPPLSSLDISEMPPEVQIAEAKTPVTIHKRYEDILDIKAELPMAPPPVHLNFLKRLAYGFKAKDKPWLTGKENAVFGGMFSKEFWQYIFSGKEPVRKRDDFLGRTSILPSILSYESGSKLQETASKTDILDPYLLEKQIKELKHIISQKKPEIYKANSLGYIANITVRKISIHYIEKYPEYFKKVYQEIRHANLKILANTYINIVVFLTLISLILSFPILTIFFAFQGGPFIIVLLKTVVGTAGLSASVFGIGMYYPSMKAKTRRRSINTNLPFAIDHMSSVIASGVSPAVMFKLISNSREYGEISIEIEKVSNYIDFFGYDILTALKAVGLVPPSQQFKEFVDGFTSTIETGGDLKQFLTQKSQEALLNYRLERQKYVESLGTYSDIYTGVLIAAPLFFVTALSLVSVLGGKIGGMDVNTIITVGTYLVIPGMNLLFIVFLELNQPEI